MSAIGTKRTWACAPHISAFDPKRTLISVRGWDRGGMNCRMRFQVRQPSHDSLLHKGAFALVEGLHGVVRWDGP